MKINEAINKARSLLKQNNIDDANLQAKILIQYILKESQSYVIANGEKKLDEYELNEYMLYINKIVNGLPIQYITNKQEFMKLNFYVDENVLIPQPDTEILVEEVIKNCNNTKKNELKILDLCTGSGAIGISLAKYIKNAKITCTDISMKALQIAKLNAERNLVHKNMNFILSDLFNNINENCFDIIVSNPPYIKTAIIESLEKQVQNEPHLALDGGKDGLDFYRNIVNNAFKYLKKDGMLYLEIGYDQKDDVINLLKNVKNYGDIRCVKDLAGIDRVIITKRK